MTQYSTKLIIILILPIFFFACSSDKDENGELAPSDFPIEEIMQEDVSFMVLSLEKYDEELEVFLIMYLKESPQDVTVKIAGNTISLEGFQNYYFAAIDLVPGQDISYELEIDNKNISGSLSVPDLIQGSFPESFDLDSDYTFSWTTSEDPTIFVAFLEIELDDDWIESGIVLQGNSRNHSFSKDNYSGLSEEEIWYVEAGVAAIDFEIRDDMVFIASTSDYQEYDFFENFMSKMEERSNNHEFKGRFPSFLLK